VAAAEDPTLYLLLHPWVVVQEMAYRAVDEATRSPVVVRVSSDHPRRSAVEAVQEDRWEEVAETPLLAPAAVVCCRHPRMLVPLPLQVVLLRQIYLHPRRRSPVLRRDRHFRMLSCA
jgi:hypothetical protein